MLENVDAKTKMENRTKIRTGKLDKRFKVITTN